MISIVLILRCDAKGWRESRQIDWGSKPRDVEKSALPKARRQRKYAHGNSSGPISTASRLPFGGIWPKAHNRSGCGSVTKPIRSDVRAYGSWPSRSATYRAAISSRERRFASASLGRSKCRVYQGLCSAKSSRMRSVTCCCANRHSAAGIMKADAALPNRYR
jgi:hypothetical protein